MGYTNMPSYASDKRFNAAGESLSVRLSSEDPISFGDFGVILKDIESIFRSASKEITSRMPGTNTKRREAILVIKEFKSGSLEIFAEPYFSGVVSGVAANAACALFVYTMRRIKGRPQDNDSEMIDRVDGNFISLEKRREAATQAVTATASARKSLNNKMKNFGLNITIRFGGNDYYVNAE